MKQTIAQKIISRHSGRNVQPGDIVVAQVDLAMATDGSAPMAIDYFSKLEAEKVKNGGKIIFVEDHYAPCPNDKVAGLHKKMNEFCAKHGCRLFRTGEGICHRLLPDEGLVKPGELVVGADSHTTTYGALNAFATGIGSSDFAGAMFTGQVWLKTPETISIQLEGCLDRGVYPKDLSLHIVSCLGADGANYCVLEFTGPGVTTLDMDGRFTICNMGVETGAKAAIFPFDQITANWIANNPKLGPQAINGQTAPDEGAPYKRTLSIDLSQLKPLLAAPHRVDNVKPVEQWLGKKIDIALIGTCTNGSIGDLRIAADILKTHDLAKHVQLLVVPPSREILLQAVDEGLVSIFLKKGAIIVTTGCGPCCGALNGVPCDKDVIISTANRNFKGRMGNVNSEVFLASPATVIASAVTGTITDPRRILQ